MNYSRIYVLVFASFLLLLAGCEYTPKGTMLFIVEGKKEYDRGYIEPIPQEGVPRGAPLRMKWVDTNTWITSATLPAGKYRFTARTDSGGYYGRDVDVTPDEVRYRMPEASGPAATPIPAIMISGTLQHSDPSVQSAEIAVLFIGRDATLRRTRANRGRWNAAAPGKGTYRVIVHTLGDRNLSYQSPPTKIDTNLDLGNMPLK